MILPTEPIGSIPRPAQLLAAAGAGTAGIRGRAEGTALAAARLGDCA